MPHEQKVNLELEIGHVLFVDIIGYSRLLITEQTETLRKLTALVRETEQFRKADAGGKLVRIPTGDGMALVFRNSPEAPAQCALELSEMLKAHPDLQVRMGVHSGPVNEVVDVNDRPNITGAGINIAQRVMDCGDAGHILLSKHVADDLEQYPQWRPVLHELGECEVKHGIRLSIVNLYNEKSGNPEIPQKLEAIPLTSRPARGRSFFVAILIMTAVVLAALMTFFIPSILKSQRKQQLNNRDSQGQPMTVTVPEKSIAVLPFENLSRDPDNAFFADGVQDEILTDLARIADLKVISRTSVMQYRTGTPRNLREIGRQLGVNRIVEGSVQRAGNRVRVNAQLIDVGNDAHLWAQTFDRDLADVFAIQSEIAKGIADQLQAKLSPAEKSAIERPPTINVVAFNLYAQARSLVANVSFTAVREGNSRRAVDLLNQAIGLDPKFVLAYASLEEAHDQLYAVIGDHTPERLAQAEMAVDRLRELEPEAGETHLAIGRHRYYAFRDYAAARSELAAAAPSLPNDSAILKLAAFIDRRAGKWEDSLLELNNAIARDPRDVFLMQQMALTYQHLRRYRDMAAVLDRALQIDPERLETKVARAQVELHWHADPKPLHDVIEAAIKADPSAAQIVAENWTLLSLYERNAEAVDQALAALGDRGFAESLVRFDKSFGKALAKYLQGDSEGFKEALKTARAVQMKRVATQPGYGPALCSLAVIDSMLGNKEDALREGREATDLVPLSADAIAGSELKAFYAVVCAWVGEKEVALKNLEEVVKSPCYLSYGQLKLSPLWDPLRTDPRFEGLVTKLARP